MATLRVVPIVEGHGEYQAIRILLQRVWVEICGGEYVDVLRPFRWPRSKLVIPQELERAVKTASLKLTQGGMILILIDANGGCPAELAPQLRERATMAAEHCRPQCVLAKTEFETWFVACAQSLSPMLDLSEPPPSDPEQFRAGKKWIADRFKGPHPYSETLDQPKLTARMDLLDCRNHSPSFDKFCRVMEAEARRLRSSPG